MVKTKSAAVLAVLTALAVAGATGAQAAPTPPVNAAGWKCGWQVSGDYAYWKNCDREHGDKLWVDTYMAPDFEVCVPSGQLKQLGPKDGQGFGAVRGVEFEGDC